MPDYQVLFGYLLLAALCTCFAFGIYRKKWYWALACGVLYAVLLSGWLLSGGLGFWLVFGKVYPFPLASLIIFGIGRLLPNVGTA
jgi:hypothetical protein